MRKNKKPFLQFLLHRFIIDLLYPNRCPCCREFLEFDDLICRSCVQELHVFAENEICFNCGKDICICDMKPAYSSCFCFCAYDDKGRSGILSLKEGRNTNFAEYLGERLADMLNYSDITSADYIVPAPITRYSRVMRGYNQSELIAAPIAKRLNADVLDILHCDKSSLLHHELNASQRAENALKITIDDIKLDDKIIVFCDDIITTGSTAMRCCSLLRECGAKEVYAAIGACTLSSLLHNKA